MSEPTADIIHDFFIARKSSLIGLKERLENAIDVKDWNNGTAPLELVFIVKDLVKIVERLTARMNSEGDVERESLIWRLAEKQTAYSKVQEKFIDDQKKEISPNPAQEGK